MKDKERRSTSLFFYQIIDLNRTYICIVCTSAALTHPLYYTIALDNGSETKYARRRHGRGLEI